MKRILVLFALAAVASGQTPSPDRLAWYKHDKFGMFIHFAPFSNLEGEWKDQPTPPGQIAEWIMHDMRIPRAEYRQMAHTFNPVKFDANAIAKLARQAGMKYLVITAKHHDGFAMYASKVSDYNLMDWTPAKRDIVKELSEACRREGIRFCVYYSHREDWDHPDGYGNFWDFDEKKQNFERYLEEKSKPQMRELLTNYGPLGLIWFDRGMDTTRHAQDFIDMVHNLQPQCLINGRVGNYGQELMGDYQNMSDNGMPNGGMDEYWETPQTLNHTWGYSRFDHDWKSSKVVIRKLVEIASKGGNYLLNIGPRADGSVPPESLEVLTGVGQWMAKNSESIYGTTANPFYDLPFGAATVKGSRLYLHVLNWPSDARLRLPALHTPVKKAFFLTDPSKALAIEKDGAIVLPSAAPDHADTVVAIDLAGPPQVDPPVVTAQDGVLRMDYMKAATNGKTVKRYNRSGAFHISKWTGPADTASWMVRVPKAGAYNVRIRYAANKDWTGGGYTISIDGKSVRGVVEATGDWYEYRDFDLGHLDLTAGRHALTVKPSAELRHYLMYFEAVELAPSVL